MQINNKRALPILLAIVCLACSAQAQTVPAAATAVDEEASFSVTGFVVEGENPLSEALTESALTPYVGLHHGIERLQQAATALETVLRSQGFGFYRVVLPPQDIGGVIKLQMFRFTLGKVVVKGNQVFTNDNILRSLPQLAAGSSPNTYQLARDLSLANESPSKRANVTFKQGEVPDTIDAAVEVADSKTLAGFVTLNNTGSDSTGYNRLTAGISHTNLFDRDQQGTVTYTTSPSDPGRVHQYGGYYRAPIYDWGGMLSVYYTRSSVSSGIVANSINVTGQGEFAGVQYAHYFAPRGDFRSFLTVGLDDKNFINDKITTLAGAALFPNYRTRPLTVSYTGRFEKKWGLWGYNVDYARNLELGGGMDTASYVANRAGASPNWSALRYGADLTVPLPSNWLLNTRLRGQFSSDSLVPGEQFGIGGAQSVRGLTERVLAGDSGVQGNLEFWTPALAENTRALLFYDFGQLRRHNDTVVPSATVTSFGAGLRWSKGNSWSASLDFAHVLSGDGNLPAGTSRNRAHFSLNWRY
jgi:hemolysin activation/secretion protein